MSDREGGSGGVPPVDEDLSLPKATVAKMITGTRA
jgi:down-regulator of transcription 1